MASVYVLTVQGTTVLLYGVFLLTAVILGLIFLARARKHVEFEAGEAELERGKMAKTMFLNLGMLCFFAVCIFLFSV